MINWKETLQHKRLAEIMNIEDDTIRFQEFARYYFIHLEPKKDNTSTTVQ